MFWKGYFGFVAVLAAMSVPFYMQTLRLWEVIDLVLFACALVGLIGFAWKKRILTGNFWKAFIILWIAWTPIYHFVVPLPAEALEVWAPSMSQSLLAVLTLIPAIPHFIALFRYAFSIPIFWQSANVAGY